MHSSILWVNIDGTNWEFFRDPTTNVCHAKCEKFFSLRSLQTSTLQHPPLMLERRVCNYTLECCLQMVERQKKDKTNLRQAKPNKTRGWHGKVEKEEGDECSRNIVVTLDIDCEEDYGDIFYQRSSIKVRMITATGLNHTSFTQLVEIISAFFSCSLGKHFHCTICSG